MPPRAIAIAPTLDRAAMYAPVKARPEPAPLVKTRPEPAQLLATVMAVEAESPEVPLAAMAYDPGVTPTGIFTLIEKLPGESELVELAVEVPNVPESPCNINVINSFGSKLMPLTVNEPPDAEHAEVAVIPIAFGSYAADADAAQPMVNHKPTIVATVMRHRFMDVRLVSGGRLWPQLRRRHDV